jgi:hypothetical protein
MGKKERQAYLYAVIERYRASRKALKTKILDEFCSVCGYSRKYAVRLLKCRRYRRPRKPGRKPVYINPGFVKALKCIWLTSDQMCSKKLKEALADYLPFYEKDYEGLSGEDRQHLLAISPASIDRLLKPVRIKFKRKRLCSTRPGTLLKNQIPIRTNHWDIHQPGFVEADTVAHCGNSLEGDFVNSLTLTDINTAWTESRAVWNKGAAEVLEKIQVIEDALPFGLKGFDCDNGSEFLNHHLYRYFSGKRDPFQFTRSRPYKKNDNAYVEQKNWTHVRHMLGYERIENPKLVELINDLYANEWSLFQNHFSPTLKLKEKVKIGSKYRKRYEKPQTPYKRIMESEQIDQSVKDDLQKLHSALNPFVLKKTINAKLKAIFKNIRLADKVRTRI